MKMTGTRTVIFIPSFAKSSRPWVKRGGDSWDALGAGVFNFNRNTGGINNGGSFRSVLS